MIWLSRIRLTPRNRSVLRLLSDSNTMHKRVMMAFPDELGDSPRKELGVLYRVDTDRRGGISLLVQSQVEPSWSRAWQDGELVSSPQDSVNVRDASALLDSIAVGARFDFRLRVNPTKRLAKEHGESRLGRGARVGLRKLDEQLAWLARKSEAHGFDLPTSEGVPYVIDADHGPSYGQAGTSRITHEGVTFEGRLRVRDADRMRAAVLDGIGTAKAFGFGLLSLAPPGSVVP